MCLSVGGELVASGESLQRAQREYFGGQGVEHHLVAFLFMRVEGDFAAVTVLLRAFLNHRACGGFDDVQQQLVGEPVAHHIVHHAGEHTVDAAARRHVTVEFLLDARGNTLVLQRHLGQRNEALVGGANLGARGGGLGRLTVRVHECLLLLHEFLGNERQEGEVELCRFGLERAVLIE